MKCKEKQEKGEISSKAASIKKNVHFEYGQTNLGEDSHHKINFSAVLSHANVTMFSLGKEDKSQLHDIYDLNSMDRDESTFHARLLKKKIKKNRNKESFIGL